MGGNRWLLGQLYFSHQHLDTCVMFIWSMTHNMYMSGGGGGLYNFWGVYFSL